MYGYIYKTTNLFNGKIYVGQKRAKQFDSHYYGSGVRITNLIKKYGIKNFTCELIEECASENELNTRECYWIKTLNATDRNIGYNLSSGGYKTRGMRHADSTKEQIRQKIKEYYKTHDNAKKGTHLSEETKMKLRQANIGKTYSEEVKQKHRGKPAWNKGIPMTEEAKKHLSEVNKGKKQNLSNEVRERKRARMLGKNNRNYGGLSDEVKQKIRESAKGKIWVTNGKERHLIKKDEFEVYSLNGFVRGRN